jgi:Concanavalin A-like lectin/glucanases superfamily
VARRPHQPDDGPPELTGTRATIVNTNDGLIAEYLFSGNTDDTSGGGHHGVLHGATWTADRFGMANRALHFDGTDDYVSIDPPPRIDDTAFSVSVWARYDAREVRQWTNTIIGQDDGNDQDQSRRVFQLSTFYGRIVWHRMIGARDPICWCPIPIGTWLHIAAVYENGEHRIFVDGECHDSIRHRFWTHATQPVHIGRKGTDDQRFFFRGDIDDVRLYNRALSSRDIRTLFEEGGWWPPARTTDAGAGDPVSGQWGRKGVAVLDLRYDGAGAVSGHIMRRDRGHTAPITRGSFDRTTGALSLEGTAAHPEDHSPIPFLIEGRLLDGEITVASTFTLYGDVSWGNYILYRIQ